VLRSNFLKFPDTHALSPELTKMGCCRITIVLAVVICNNECGFIAQNEFILESA